MRSPPGPGPAASPFAPLTARGTRISTLAVPTGTLTVYLPSSSRAPAVAALPSLGKNEMDDPAAGVWPSTVTAPLTTPVLEPPVQPARASRAPRRLAAPVKHLVRIVHLGLGLLIDLGHLAAGD